MSAHGKVTIVNGPAGLPMRRRVTRLTSQGVAVREATSADELHYSWTGAFLSGRETFAGSSIDHRDLADLRSKPRDKE